MRKNITKNTILTDHIRAVLKDPTALSNIKPQTRAKFFFDQRQKMNDSLEYLNFMLNYLPEKQLKQIFNKETIKPFFQALFQLKTENRKRILGLWYTILTQVAHEHYIRNFVGRERWQIMQTKSTALQALYATVFFET